MSEALLEILERELIARIDQKKMMFALLVAFRQSRRDIGLELVGSKWPEHEPAGDFMSFEPRDEIERKYLKFVTQMLSAQGAI